MTCKRYIVNAIRDSFSNYTPWSHEDKSDGRRTEEKRLEKGSHNDSAHRQEDM